MSRSPMMTFPGKISLGSQQLFSPSLYISSPSRPSTRILAGSRGLWMLKSYISCTWDFRYQRAFRSSVLLFYARGTEFHTRYLQPQPTPCRLQQSPMDISFLKQYHPQSPVSCTPSPSVRSEAGKSVFNTPIAVHISGLPRHKGERSLRTQFQKFHIEPSRSLILASPV